MYRNRRFNSLLTLTLVLGFAFSCSGSGGGGGDGGGSGDPVDTTPTPVASAGPDQTVLAGTVVSLDGSGSSHAETYAWSFTSKPAGIIPILSSATVSHPTFTPGLAGIYELSLIVSNSTKSSSPDTVTITSVNPSRVPDTGQSKCYETVGTIKLCAGSGQDAAYNVISQPSYTDNGNETITDNVTGLMWQKCTLGRRGDTCTVGTLGAYTWYTATGTADPASNPGGATSACGDLTLAGYSDWRLPTESELMTLVYYSGFYLRAIHDTYFPGTQTSPYWSSTAYANPLDDTNAWFLGYTSGTFEKTLKTAQGRVRCVRGAQFAPFFIDNGDGTVTNMAAGGIWQKQDDGTARTWSDAIAFCEALSLAGHDDWRLPNAKELSSIADFTKFSPAVNSTYFPGTQPYHYWSSTTDVETTSQAWTIDFNDGSTGRSSKAGATGTYARCVRDQ